MLFITNNNLLSIIQTYLFVTHCLFVDVYKKYVHVYLLLLLCYNFLLQNIQVQNRTKLIVLLLLLL